MNDQDKNSTLLALIAGVVIGAGVTYLFTTKEGQKIKEKLIVQGTKLLEDFKGTLEEQTEKIVDQIEAVAHQKLDDLNESGEEIADQVPQQIQEIQKKGRRFFFKKHAVHASPES